jgi:hypothetical protein
VTERTLLGIAFGCAVLVLCLWFWRRDRNAPLPQLPGVSAIPRARAKSELEKEAEIKTIKLKSPTEVSVRASVRKWCGLGDMDGVKLELEHRAEKTLLLTVEPLDQNARSAPALRRVEYAELEAGLKHSFTIPPGGSDGLLGVFLCSDSSHAGRCAGKKDADVTQIVNNYAIKGNPHANDVPEDHVYFFQFVLANHGEASMFEKANPPALAHRRFARFAATKIQDAKAVSSVLDAVEKRNVSVRSLALDTDDAQDADVRIVLPEYDAEACARKEYPTSGKRKFDPPK